MKLQFSLNNFRKTTMFLYTYELLGHRCKLRRVTKPETELVWFGRHSTCFTTYVNNNKRIIFFYLYLQTSINTIAIMAGNSKQ